MTTRRRSDLAMDAAGHAQRVRKEAGIGPQEPASVFDVIDGLGIELRFVSVPSLEGMYQRRPSPVILLSSLRPPGRQAYTGAHELGHHVYGHGVMVDEVSEGAGREPDTSVDPKEYLADRFAGFFMMPKTAVKYGFRSRGWEPGDCTPRQAYTVAGWLGVGYTTLIHHMRGSLRLLNYRRAEKLLKATPKDIRAQILGRKVRENLVVVDDRWIGRAVDAQVGDLILAPPGTVCAAHYLHVAEETRAGVLIAGTAPGGDGRLYLPGADWAAFVRISRKDYEGLWPYRHWEDPDHGVRHD